MQTILGANGQIAVELARELHRNYTQNLRLVSRKPRKVNDTDELVSADLMNSAQTLEAVRGSEVVYFTAGLPPDTELWEGQFPAMLRNALDATRAAGPSLSTLTTPTCTRKARSGRPRKPPLPRWAARGACAP